MSTISGMPSDRSDASSVPPQSCSASSSLSLSAVMWPRTARSIAAVADERADPAVTDEPLGVDDEPMAARGERCQRLEREVVAGERADDHPGSVADRVPHPAVDVRRRPRIGERVDRHDSLVALVVEREARRPLGGAASGRGSRTPRARARAASRSSAAERQTSTTSASGSISLRARAQYQTMPPGRSGAPATTSSTRFPTIAARGIRRCTRRRRLPRASRAPTPRRRPSTGGRARRPCTRRP